MATLYHYFSEKGRVGGPWTHSTRDSVRVSEVWEHRDGRAQRYSSQSMVMSESNVKKWLETPDGHDTSSCTGDGSSVRRLRIVWIPRLVQNRMFDVSEAIFKVVHDITELALAQKYCETTSAGIGTVPNPLKTRILQHFSYQPKISLVWTADVKCQVTTMICSADEPKLSILEGLISQEFAQRVAGHPLAGALFSMVLFTQEIQDTQEAIKQQVRHVEVRTGHHDWKSRVEKPALGDLLALAARMSGCETRIGSCLRKQSVLNEMIGFFEKDSGGNGSGEKTDEIPRELLTLVLESVDILKRRAAAQEIDTTFIQRRVRTQIDAIYHLVQENDAWSANEMARDCKLLAMASQHDSASMKCIAVVTMFFLPGTFVAALMSIPLFDWQAESTRLMRRTSFWLPRITIFLALTLPIMSVTFGIWGFWTLMRHVKGRKRITSAQTQLRQAVLEDETRTLLMRRKSLTDKFLEPKT